MFTPQSNYLNRFSSIMSNKQQKVKVTALVTTPEKGDTDVGEKRSPFMESLMERAKKSPKLEAKTKYGPKGLTVFSISITEETYFDVLPHEDSFDQAPYGSGLLVCGMVIGGSETYKAKDFIKGRSGSLSKDTFLDGRKIELTVRGLQYTGDETLEEKFKVLVKLSVFDHMQSFLLLTFLFFQVADDGEGTPVPANFPTGANKWWYGPDEDLIKIVEADGDVRADLATYKKLQTDFGGLPVKTGPAITMDFPETIILSCEQFSHIVKMWGTGSIKKTK
jgi:hypothetical protein